MRGLLLLVVVVVMVAGVAMEGACGLGQAQEEEEAREGLDRGQEHAEEGIASGPRRTWPAFRASTAMQATFVQAINRHLEDYHLVRRGEMKLSQHRLDAGGIDALELAFDLTQGEKVSFHLVANTEPFHRGTRVLAVNQNGVREVQHDLHSVFWKDDEHARFRIEDGRVVSGSFTLNGTRYTLDSLDHMLRWERLREEEQAVFGSAAVFARETAQLLAVYHLGSLKWPHHPFKGRGTGFPACHSDHLAARAEELTAGMPTASTHRRRRAASEDTCLLALVGDYRFFRHVGSNTGAAVNTMVEYITYVDRNFRSTEFGQFEGIGVGVSVVIVYEDANTDPYYKSSTWDVSELLEKLSERPESPLDWSSVCLVHLFTYQDFANGVQGLAWVGNERNGGICDGFGDARSAYLNTGLTTGINWGTDLMKLTWELTVQHELGHNFGSPHDPDTTQCAPSGNHYVMYASAVDGTSPNNALFSPCSTSNVEAIIASRGTCFVPTPANICGNGILETAGADDAEGTSDDEECDEGYSGGPCCTSTCKLRGNSVCSDNNFECCTDCQADPSKLCFKAFPLDVRCRADTYCEAGSFECPTVNQKPEGTECVNHGHCVPHNDPNERCFSFCASFGASECECEEGSGNECSLCCVDDDTVTTLYCPQGYAWNETISACQSETNPNDQQAGARPFSSTCSAAHEVLGTSQFEHVRTPAGEPVSRAALALTPGSVCPGGSCSDEGLCVAAPDDFASQIFSFFSGLTLNDIKEWMLRNIVPAVLVLASLFWIPAACCLAKKDAKKLAELEDQAEKLESHRQDYVARKRHGPRPSSAFRLKQQPQGDPSLTRIAPVEQIPMENYNSRHGSANHPSRHQPAWAQGALQQQQQNYAGVQYHTSHA